MPDPVVKAIAPVFLAGETVQLNAKNSKNAKLHDRTGVIVGPSRLPGKFRVLWDGLKHPQLVQATLLRPADTQRPTDQVAARRMSLQRSETSWSGSAALALNGISECRA